MRRLHLSPDLCDGRGLAQVSTERVHAPQRRAILVVMTAQLLTTHVDAQSLTEGPASDRVRANLRQILSQQEFQPSTDTSRQANALGQKIQKLGDYLQHQWNRFWDWLSSLFHVQASLGSSVRTTFVYALLGVMIVFAAWLLAAVIKNRAPEALSRRKRAIVTSLDQEDPVPEPEAWISQSEQFAAKGEYRLAFRALFVALLLKMDRAGKIKWEASRTNGDYLSELRAGRQTQIYDMFLPLALEFDRRWYGHTQTDESDYRRCLAACRALSEMAAAKIQRASDLPGGSAVGTAR